MLVKSEQQFGRAAVIKTGALFKFDKMCHFIGQVAGKINRFHIPPPAIPMQLRQGS